MEIVHDRVEIINSQSPNYPHTTVNYFLKDELIKKNFSDEEEDKTEYFKNGKLHREHEPAVVIKDASGFSFQYYNEGKLDRKDGPAIVFANYPNLNKWFIEGKELSMSEILIQKMKIIRNKSLQKINESDLNPYSKIFKK